jgi:predicted metal-dependent peptidase
MFFETKLTPRERLIKAKLSLRIRTPMWFGMLMYLDVEERNEIPTLAVNGEDKIFYNSEFVEQTSLEDLSIILVHELLHLLFGHPLTAKSNHGIDKYATDIKINNILNNEGLHVSDKLKKESIWPKGNSISLELRDRDKKMHEFTFNNIDHLTRDYIYDRMAYVILPEDDKSQNPRPGDHKSQNPGPGDHSMFSDNQDKSGTAKDQRRWAQRLSQESMRGKISGEMERLIKSLVAPEVEWYELLRDTINGTQITDYTWSKPSKLYFATGIYLPGYKREDFSMIVAIDTSGSITDKDLRKAMSEIYGVYDSHPSCSLDILIGDAELREHRSITSQTRQDILTLKNLGGGGTSHDFVFKWIQDNQKTPNVLVMFTDGDSDIEDCVHKYNPEYELVFIWKRSQFNERLDKYGTIIYIGDK